MISEQLLELLVCPVCHDRLVVVPERDGLTCERCRLLFPIRNGIPVMLPDEAQKIPAPDTEAAGQ